MIKPLTLATLLLLLLVAQTSVSSEVNVPAGQTLIINNQNVTIQGNFTSLKATVTITNSTIQGTGKLQFTYGSITIINSTIRDFTSVSILYSGKLVIQNLTIQNLSQPLSLSCITNYKVDGLTFTDCKPITLLDLYKMCNGAITGLSYTYTTKTLVGCAVSLVKCSNLTFNQATGTGPRTVDSPHHHILACGTENRDITIQNSMFHGGGNGGTAGVSNFINCTFINNTDGAESKGTTPANFKNCTWIGTHDAEINLQSGAQFNFVACTFTKGLVNLNNGLATVTNCTFPNGVVMADLGGNRDGITHQGVVWQFWNYTHYYKVSVADWGLNAQNLNYTLMPD